MLPTVRRPLVVLLFLAIFAGELMWHAIVPLVPAFSQRFGLTKLEGGELLASTSVAILLVSIPAGMLSERFGVRRLTLVSLAVMAAADLGQGMAGSFVALLGARALFGLGFGILWTAGVAWLSEVSGDRHAQALSLTVTTAGIGGIAGPAFAGVLVQRFGLAAPFTVAAVATLAVMVALMLDPSGSGGAVEVTQPLVSIVRAAVSDHGVLVSVVLMSLGGLIGGVVNLLVPLQLHQNGMSTASIGLLFGVSAAAFIASSAVTARFGDRAARNEVAVVVSLMAAAVMVLPALGATTAVLVAFLLVRAPIMALMFTITFPIGVAGARRAGITVAAVAALINIVWSASVLAGPLLAGLIAETVGNRLAFVMLSVASLASAAWIMNGNRREAAAPACGASSRAR
jgi:MFS family permease